MDKKELIKTILEKNITLILGGIFNSGILNEPSPNSYFDYSKLDKNWLISDRTVLTLTFLKYFPAISLKDFEDIE